MAKPNSVVELLQTLVRIPSVNPFAPDSASKPYLGEGKCANFLADFLQDLRAEVVLEEIEPDRPNVIAHFPADHPGKPKVILGPHIDTVSIQGMTIDPFAAEIRDGKLYGRGAADTKGTMAAMLWALKELGPERIARLPVDVTFVGFMGEENSQPGSRHFAKHHPNYDFAVIGEPTNMDVVYTHKGTTWVQLIATGKSAHGARPELGDNAILKLARVLDHLDQTFQPILDTFKHDVLGRSTMNIGQIRGGIQPNIVPDKATANVDFRLTPELAKRGLLDLLREQVPEAMELKVGLECQPLNTDPDHPMVNTLAAAGSGKKVGAPWFCDAAHLAAAEIPSVAAGPGSIDQAHTEDEWISIESLEEGVNFYRGFLETC
ncbi:MAG: M20 family metallopeptidase [Verrucomicrobiales bacterium]|nr:M20/M25/M40 family metallo-hydrolase [Verrucomicrobiaceae bacterium]